MQLRLFIILVCAFCFSIKLGEGTAWGSNLARLPHIRSILAEADAEKKNCAEVLEVHDVPPDDDLMNTSVLIGLRGKTVWERELQIASAELLAEMGAQVKDGESRDLMRLWAQGFNLDRAPKDLPSSSRAALHRAEFERAYLQERHLGGQSVATLLAPEPDGVFGRLRPARLRYVILPLFVAALSTLHEKDRPAAVMRTIESLPWLTHVEVAQILLSLPPGERERFATRLATRVFTSKSMYDPELYTRLMDGLNFRVLDLLSPADRTQTRAMAELKARRAQWMLGIVLGSALASGTYQYAEMSHALPWQRPAHAVVDSRTLAQTAFRNASPESVAMIDAWRSNGGKIEDLAIDLAEVKDRTRRADLRREIWAVLSAEATPLQSIAYWKLADEAEQAQALDGYLLARAAELGPVDAVLILSSISVERVRDHAALAYVDYRPDLVRSDLDRVLEGPLSSRIQQRIRDLRILRKK